MTDHETTDRGTSPIDLSIADFAALGAGKIAYIKTIRSEDVRLLVPQAPEMPPGLDLVALLGADGQPIMITDSRDDIAQTAWDNDLTTVSVH
jgi:hypothetical protein